MNQRARTSFNNSSVIRRGANMGMPPLTWHHWAVLHIMAEMLGYWVSSLVYRYDIEFFFSYFTKVLNYCYLSKKNIFWFMKYLLSFFCQQHLELERNQNSSKLASCQYLLWSRYTPARTLSIIGLKSRVLKLTLLT